MAKCEAEKCLFLYLEFFATLDLPQKNRKNAQNLHNTTFISPFEKKLNKIARKNFSFTSFNFYIEQVHFQKKLKTQLI